MLPILCKSITWKILIYCQFVNWILRSKLLIKIKIYLFWVLVCNSFIYSLIAHTFDFFFLTQYTINMTRSCKLWTGCKYIFSMLSTIFFICCSFCGFLVICVNEQHHYATIGVSWCTTLSFFYPKELDLVITALADALVLNDTRPLWDIVLT